MTEIVKTCNLKFHAPMFSITISNLIHIADQNAKVGSQKIPGVAGKFGLGVQNEAGHRLTEFYQENTLDIANTLFQWHNRHHQIVNTEIRLITFFADEDGVALHSQQEEDLELTVAQIMSFISQIQVYLFIYFSINLQYFIANLGLN